MPNISMKEMIKSGVHFGHQTRFWNPKMKDYIHSSRNKIHIINLDYTVRNFQEALDFIQAQSAKKQKVLFVGTKRSAAALVKDYAARCGMPFVNHRWLGGMLTNWKTNRQSIKYLRELEQQTLDGTLDKLTKKEALLKKREKEKLELGLGGIKDMGGLPQVMFVIDVEHERIAVSEANKLGIPVVAIVDTNSNPKGVNYVVPGNDDGIKAIELYLRLVSEACLEGKEYAKTHGLIDKEGQVEGEDVAVVPVSASETGEGAKDNG